MKSAYRAPTARRGELDRLWRFTPDVQKAYKNDLDALPEPGDRFTFTNGPYGGGRKFEVVRTSIKEDGLLVVAKEI